MNPLLFAAAGALLGLLVAKKVTEKQPGKATEKKRLTGKKKSGPLAPESSKESAKNDKPDDSDSSNDRDSDGDSGTTGNAET